MLCRLYVALKVYNSKECIDVQQFKNFCLETYNLILTKFENEETKWISISQTVHSLLAHGWELISFNDGKGLGEYTESGLEHNSKFLRFFRQNLARKVNQSANLEDCLTRHWLPSDPLIREAAPKPSCSRCPFSQHYTVSCPKKIRPHVHSSQTMDEFFLSLIFTHCLTSE